ncbi:nitrate/nitrite transporter [Pseudozobellia sp. WGM2]|uniref:MFS transporter n=1 Tax=Pseudozobellia sp. WGM2 TaxID=2787625 RepID=UPI001ADF0166|nr:MFS transporter [Pseudozobellia sp. WGM2]
MKPKKHILPIIIIAQFACTSVWFAGNSIVNELAQVTGFGSELIGYILSSVQFGFILGTLTFALLTIADRFSPSKVFLVCAILASGCNILLLAGGISKIGLLAARFGTGFFLAGIYPIGMKIAADYYEKGLGLALGYLVGALVFGKSLPYFIKSLQWGNYESVVQATSIFTILGGLLLWLTVPDGPYRKKGKKLRLKAGPELFKIINFRKAAFGYFGHMWELYAFWGFLPFAIITFNRISGETLYVPFYTSLLIAAGGLGCIIGGYFSITHSSKKVAFLTLLISGLCCMFSPIFYHLPAYLFLTLFALWGFMVAADSPQFSSMVASAVPVDLRGTALTLVNCLGYIISILSIELISLLSKTFRAEYVFVILAIGPIFGLIHLRNHK